MHSFSDIYGNALLLRHLQQAVAGGRVSHAYLLTGSSGSGKPAHCGYLCQNIAV